MCLRTERPVKPTNKSSDFDLIFDKMHLVVLSKFITSTITNNNFMLILITYTTSIVTTVTATTEMLLCCLY